MWHALPLLRTGTHTLGKLIRGIAGLKGHMLPQCSKVGAKLRCDIPDFFFFFLGCYSNGETFMLVLRCIGQLFFFTRKKEHARCFSTHQRFGSNNMLYVSAELFVEL